MEDVLEALEAGHARRSLSLDAPRPGEDGDAAPRVETIPARERGFDRVEAGLAAADAELDEREWEVLRMRFAEELTQSEIGERLGVSQMQISRISRAALWKLLAAVRGEDAEGSGASRGAARRRRELICRPRQRVGEGEGENERKEHRMSGEIEGKRVAFLVANEGVEQVELTQPWEAIEAAGGEPELIAPEAGEVQAMQHLEKGDTFEATRAVSDADAGDYDALVLPGGVANPDILRTEPDAVEFTRAFFEAGKPVAAICHAPWTLVEAGVADGRTLTSWPSLQDGHRERRRHVGRRGGPRRRRSGHQPQARRPRRVLCEGDRGDRRGRARRAARGDDAS